MRRFLLGLLVLVGSGLPAASCLDTSLGIQPPGADEIVEVQGAETMPGELPAPPDAAAADADNAAGDPCGDGMCDAPAGEDKTTCPLDCCTFNACGNGQCKREGNCGETGETCPEDCCVCGDGLCEAACGETLPGPGSCPDDC